jgi:hypothetical protein
MSSIEFATNSDRNEGPLDFAMNASNKSSLAVGLLF